MKTHLIAVSIALAVSPSVLATDYQGKSLDGRVLACKAMDDYTQKVYEVKAAFKDPNVTLTFPDGKTLTLSVQEKPITDPGVITLVGFPKTGELLYWALDCSKSLGR